MKLAIIGSGYVGLVTGVCFAELGHQVLCMDHDFQKVAQLQGGQAPIHEPGLQALLEVNLRQQRLRFSSRIEDAVDFAEVIFICVGTPALPDGQVDLRAMETAIAAIAGRMQSYKLIVEKSTVPVQTAASLQMLAHKHLEGREVPFDLASNPEFLSEGRAIADFMQPDRIVLGVASERASALLVKLYAPLNAPLLITDINSAELIKHASNAFLAMKISYANALARICELTGADIHKVTRGMGLDRRIGQAFLQAGIGYGGSCFPKDTAGFIKMAEAAGYDFELLKAVQAINQDQQAYFVRKVRAALGGDLAGKSLAALGLSFKPNTDDVREAPALAIICLLLAEGVRVTVYDPVAMGNAARILQDSVCYAADPYTACEQADAVLFLTEWEVFRYLDLPRLKTLLKQPVMLDGRNIFEPAKMQQLGFIYQGIGQKETALGH